MERVKKAIDAYLEKKKEIKERDELRCNRFAELDKETRRFFSDSKIDMKIGTFSDYRIVFDHEGVLVTKNEVCVPESMIDDELWDYLVSSLTAIINATTESL